MTFELPAIGSYQRPVIGKAEDARVIDQSGRSTSLHELMHGKVTLLSFMYTSCSDVNGCPLASYVLNRVMQQVAGDPRLTDHVQLLSLSFDPANDTPEVLQNYAQRFEADQSDNWHFVTPVSEQVLAETLENYNQFIIKDRDAAGNVVGTISHLLRVYLVDPEQNLREVYSVSFLHADVLIQDMLTILAGARKTKHEN